MKKNTFKNHLSSLQNLQFLQQDGTAVPAHFHITEAGICKRNYIDCGGTIREEKYFSMQIWVDRDIDHRLSPSKLLKIIDKYESVFGEEDMEIEMEYQATTIGRFGVDIQDNYFILTPKMTDCLAKDKCGIPVQKEKRSLASLTPVNSACCTPGGNCCS